MTRRAPATERGFDRLLFFSDAVVAIAITLLILPLVDSVSKDASLSHLLDVERDRFIAFAVSFAVIARFWIAHHSLCERIDKYNMPLVRANMLWLVTIIFLPFPTELLSVRGTSEAAVRFVYIASVLAGSACLLLLQIAIRRSPQLWSENDRVEDSLAGATINVFLLVVALIIGTTVAPVGMYALLLLLAAGPLEALINRRISARRVSA